MPRVTPVASSLPALPALLPLLALLMVAGCGLGQDVGDYVAMTYSRAAGLDDGSARAFTASGDRRAVASTIATAKRPLDRLDTGATSYLQYQNAIVRVAPNGGGSLIRVDTYGNGYRRWASDIASRWGPAPPDDDYDGK